MTIVRGITVLDLIARLPAGVQGFIPANVAQFLELLAIVDHKSLTSGRFYIHQGVVQSAQDAGLQLPGGFPLIIPGLNRGVGFQFTHDRTAVAATENIEGPESLFQLDLFLNQVGIPLPFVKPAARVQSAPAQPGYLVPDPSRNTVQLIGSGVLRITGGTGGVQVALISQPNPFAPTDPTGAVLEFNLAPKHLLLHDSGLGLSIDKVVWDQSTTYTPPEIEARSHDATWTGLAIKEASLYLPRDLPFFGDVSLGVRDVIIGFNPAGFQGEAQLELGQAPNVAPFQFFQDNGQGPVACALSGSGRSRDVVLPVNTGASARMLVRIASTTPVSWLLPGTGSWTTDSTAANPKSTPWFTITPDSATAVLRVRGKVQSDAGLVDGPEYTFRFRTSHNLSTPRLLPPRLRVTPQGGPDFDNTTSVSGQASALQGLTFRALPVLATAPEDVQRWTWTLFHQGAELTGRGDTFTPQVAWERGWHWLRFTDHLGQHRHLQLEVVESGTLVIGCEAGAKDGTGATLGITQVEGTWSLDSFHEAGTRAAADDTASLANGSLSVAAGSLAEVALELRPQTGGGEAPTPSPQRSVLHVRVLMEFDRTQPTGLRHYLSTTSPDDPWGRSEPFPYTGDGSDVDPGDQDEFYQAWSTSALAAWTSTLPPGTRLVVIGRCCDIGDTSYNQQLGRERAEEGKRLLLGLTLSDGTPLTDANIYARGENTGSAQGTYPSNTTDYTSPAHQPLLSARTQTHWRIKDTFSSSVRATWHGNDQAERKEYRGVDIYAVIPAAQASQQPGTTRDQDALAPSRRRALVPGADLTQPPAITPREPEVHYRLQLLAKWDSPTFADARDAIPTLVQLTLDWQAPPDGLPVPGAGNGAVAPQPPGGTPPATPITYQLIGRLAYDPRGGQTVITLSLDTPGDDRGLFDIVSADAGNAGGKALATALAFGPALLGGIQTDDPGGAAVRLGALFGVIGAVTATGIVTQGIATLQRFEIEHALLAPNDGTGSKTKLVVDYTVSLAINTDVIQTADPVKVRYKNVGILIDNSKSGLDALSFIYEDADFQIVDPGRWTMQGALGELLGVTEVRLGAGSVWFEVDLTFGLDLGVIQVTKATVRITLSNGSVSVELRGLGAKVDVPNVVKGSGQLKVGAAGDLSAAIDVNIIPADISAWGALVLRKPMTQIAAGVRFATPIPLFSTGLGIYGFMGRFVSNGTRDVVRTGDRVANELAWYVKPELQKYTPLEGQYALGLGAIVGTMPDAGYSFNAVGMLAVEFPDPSVVFGIDAKFLSKPESAPKEEGTPNGNTFKMLGLIAVDSDGVVVGVRGSYEIPKLLKVKVPAGAYFPFSSSGSSYVRIGADGVNGRSGDPVTLTIFPGLLDVKAWAYFMAEERQLHKLGGEDALSFDGFSLGFGAGWSIKWGGSSIYLRASAKVLVGLGTKPFVLMGKARVDGELRLVIVTISVSGEVTVRLSDNGNYLHGKFCGKVSFLFFDVEGCVEFKINGNPSVTAPDPGPLVTSISLADPYARITGEGTSGVPGQAHTSWPDTCPVLRFSHRVGLALQAGSFKPMPQSGWPGNDWSGATRLKYLYRLEAVRLYEGTTLLDTTDWVSVWWLPSHKPALPQPGQAASSEHEGWDLALLHWDLAPWARNLPQGGEGVAADPAQTIGKLCDPPPALLRGCVLGQVFKRLGPDKVRLRQQQPGTPPYGSNFELLGTEGLYPQSLADAVTHAVNQGKQFTPGQAVDLPDLYTLPDGVKVTQAYRLPYLSTQASGFENLSLEGKPDRAVSQPDMVIGLYHQMPVGGSTVDTCVTFAGFAPGQAVASPFVHEGLTFSDSEDKSYFVDVEPKPRPDGVPELGFSRQVRIALPAPTRRVTAYVGLTTPPTQYNEAYLIRLSAYDSTNVLIGQATTPNTTGVLTKLEVTSTTTNIAYVLVTGGAGAGYLQKFCYLATIPQEPDYTSMAKEYFEKLQLTPSVQGVSAAGTASGWYVQVLGMQVVGREACQYLQYTPSPKLPPPARLRILPYKAGPRVLVLSLCGYTLQASAAQAADQQAHTDLKDLLNTAGNAADATKRHRLLKANTEYTVEVSYSYAAWLPTDDTETQPPDASTFGWTSGGSVQVVTGRKDTFKFRTSPAGTLPDNQVLSAEVQHTFDVRSLGRYLKGFAPARPQPTHFLDDDLRVFFEVEWIPTLLERYGRELKLRVARTDPPPYQQGQSPLVLAVPTVTSWSSLPLELRPRADQRIAEVLTSGTAPCLTPQPPAQGATGSVTGPLEPDADYDFIVGAVLQGSGTGEIIIDRSHLHTSRYKNPAALITALGFTTPTANPQMPLDLLLADDAVLPTDTVLDNDAQLDAALQALKLDPWPLPTEPRTCLLWKLVGGVWKLVGVLLDSDEAMNRDKRLGDTAARMSVTQCKVTASSLNVAFSACRGNSSATRLLFRTPSPLTLPSDPLLSLELVFTDRGTAKTHRRALNALPSLILKETQP